MIAFGIIMGMQNFSATMTLPSTVSAPRVYKNTVGYVMWYFESNKNQPDKC
jgi:hypothetical protein